MKNYILFWVGLSLLFFVGCDTPAGGGTSQGKTTGYLYPNAVLDHEGRIAAVPGDHLAGRIQLSHDPAPEGAHDGDSGEDLFIEIEDETLLEPGRVFTVKDTLFQLYVVKWASPAGYSVIPPDSLEGLVEVLTYVPQDKLELSLDLAFSHYGKEQRFERKVEFSISSM